MSSRLYRSDSNGSSVSSNGGKKSEEGGYQSFSTNSQLFPTTLSHSSSVGNWGQFVSLTPSSKPNSFVMEHGAIASKAIHSPGRERKISAPPSLERQHDFEHMMKRKRLSKLPSGEDYSFSDCFASSETNLRKGMAEKSVRRADSSRTLDQERDTVSTSTTHVNKDVEANLRQNINEIDDFCRKWYATTVVLCVVMSVLLIGMGCFAAYALFAGHLSQDVIVLKVFLFLFYVLTEISVLSFLMCHVVFRVRSQQNGSLESSSYLWTRLLPPDQSMFVEEDGRVRSKESAHKSSYITLAAFIVMVVLSLSMHVLAATGTLDDWIAHCKEPSDSLRMAAIPLFACTCGAFVCIKYVRKALYGLSRLQKQ